MISRMEGSALSLALLYTLSKREVRYIKERRSAKECEVGTQFQSQDWY